MKDAGLPPFSWRRLAIVTGLLSGACLLYYNALGHRAVWDDHRYVFSDPFLTDCANLARVLSPASLARPLPIRNAARPAWLASVLLDRCLYGDRVPGYRATSVLWHAFGAGFLALLAWLLSRRAWPALLAGLLFAAHPLHAEAVNIITFRADALSFAGAALALCLYLRWRDETGRRAGLFLAAALAAFALALLAKEMALALPLLAVLSDRLFPPARGAGPAWARRRRAAYAAFLVVAALYLAFRAPRADYSMRGHEDSLGALESAAAPAPEPGAEAQGAVRVPSDPPPWSLVYESPRARLLTYSAIWGEYLVQLFWPARLQGDYSPRPLTSAAEPAVWLSWLAWLGLLAAAWRLRRVEPLAAFGLLWIPVALLPVSGLVTLANLRADRYLYTPSAGACLAAAAGLGWLARLPWKGARAAAAALGALCVLGLAGRTFLRNRDFRDDLSYLEATLKADPGVARAHFNLARWYGLYGDAPGADREFREALRLWPSAVFARVSYGQFLAAKARGRESVAVLREAAALSPDDPWVRYWLGLTLASEGDKTGGLAELEKAAALAPGFWQARLQAGVILVEAKRPREAEPLLREALRLTRWKNDLALLYLAKACRGSGREREARRLGTLLWLTAPRLAPMLSGGAPSSLRFGR